MAPSQALTTNFPTTTKDLRRRFEEMASEHVKRMGARIKDRREELGMTQRQLADQVGGATDGNQVSKWERGSNRPSDAKLEKLAAALQVDPSFFHTPPPVTGTGDLMETFGGETQLDRIEAKLETILTRLDTGVSTPEEAERFAALERQIATLLRRSADGGPPPPPSGLLQPPAGADRGTDEARPADRDSGGG